MNDDASRNISHTITRFRLPCNGSPGIGYPLADEGPDPFRFRRTGLRPARLDGGGEPGGVGDPAGPEAPGLYAYFCRIHPFMRGAFRVVRAPRGASTVLWTT